MTVHVPEQTVRTTCPYCGVGCGILATPDGAGGLAVAGDPEWDGVPDDWHARAEAVMPKPKVPVSIRLDADLVEHFRSSGRGWQTRVNAILRAYVQGKNSPAA